MIYRPYQIDFERDIYIAWETYANILAVLSTAAGKTAIFAKILSEHKGPSVAIAHRQELVFQISIALARNGLRHRIIGPIEVIKLVVQMHMIELGRSYYDSNAPCAVAGVDTLIRRIDNLRPWADSVTLWVVDEGHHLLVKNKWGRASAMFPKARGLGVTATPIRADGKGLGRDYDGVFDTIVEGVDMRELIDQGYLTDYRIFAPPSNLNLEDVNITSTGDYSRPKLKKAVMRSRIIGDIVEHYKKIAPGKLGITFTPDVETAGLVADQFNSAGVPASVITAGTPDKSRTSILNSFRRKEILQLVNVDLFGEGFDLPALEVVSMARPTQSYAVYAQQFGRALRPMQGKEKAIIIDHVGNVERHGLPDSPRSWSLNRREFRTRTSPDGLIPLKACARCTRVYERTSRECPHCGYYPAPAARSKPEFVDGDLFELDPEVLMKMRQAIDRIDLDSEAVRLEMVKKFAPKIGQLAHVKRHVERQVAQKLLRESISWWAGFERSLGHDDSHIYRKFFFRFGVDILGAQALNTDGAEKLTVKVNEKLGGLYASIQ